MRIRWWLVASPVWSGRRKGAAESLGVIGKLARPQSITTAYFNSIWRAGIVFGKSRTKGIVPEANYSAGRLRR